MFFGEVLYKRRSHWFQPNAYSVHNGSLQRFFRSVCRPRTLVFLRALACPQCLSLSMEHRETFLSLCGYQARYGRSRRDCHFAKLPALLGARKISWMKRLKVKGQSDLLPVRIENINNDALCDYAEFNKRCPTLHKDLAGQKSKTLSASLWTKRVCRVLSHRIISLYGRSLRFG